MSGSDCNIESTPCQGTTRSVACVQLAQLAVHTCGCQCLTRLSCASQLAVVLNEDGKIDQCVAEISSIIAAEKARVR